MAPLGPGRTAAAADLADGPVGAEHEAMGPKGGEQHGEPGVQGGEDGVGGVGRGERGVRFAEGARELHVCLGVAAEVEDGSAPGGEGGGCGGVGGGVGVGQVGFAEVVWWRICQM